MENNRSRKPGRSNRFIPLLLFFAMAATGWSPSVSVEAADRPLDRYSSEDLMIAVDAGVIAVGGGVVRIDAQAPALTIHVTAAHRATIEVSGIAYGDIEVTGVTPDAYSVGNKLIRLTVSGERLVRIVSRKSTPLVFVVGSFRSGDFPAIMKILKRSDHQPDFLVDDFFGADSVAPFSRVVLCQSRRARCEDEGLRGTYSFDYKGAHFVVLDARTYTTEDLRWLHDDLVNAVPERLFVFSPLPIVDAERHIITGMSGVFSLIAAVADRYTVREILSIGPTADFSQNVRGAVYRNVSRRSTLAEVRIENGVVVERQITVANGLSADLAILFRTLGVLALDNPFAALVLCAIALVIIVAFIAFVIGHRRTAGSRRIQL